MVGVDVGGLCAVIRGDDGIGMAYVIVGGVADYGVCVGLVVVVVVVVVVGGCVDMICIVAGVDVVVFWCCYLWYWRYWC